MIYRNRIVLRDGPGPGKEDPGKIDSLGDRNWTRWHGSANVRVEDINGTVLSPVISELYHRISGYRWTWSDDISETRLVCGGDFFFLKGEGRTFGRNDDNFVYLLFSETTEPIDQEDIKVAEKELAIPVQTELFFDTELKGENSWSSTEILHPTSEEWLAKKEEWLNKADEYLQEQLQKYPKVFVCGPAIRIKLLQDKEWGPWRWLYPHPDGVRAAIKRLNNTTDEDDWLALQDHLTSCTELEQNRVFAHFENL